MQNDLPGFGDEQSLRAQGEAQLSLGRSLLELGRYGPAIEPLQAAYETLWRVPDRQGAAAHARIRLVMALAATHRHELALSTVNDIIGWEIDIPELPAEMPFAHWLRVFVLRELGRDREAMDCARELVERYGPGSDQHVREIVASALMAESELANQLGRPARAARAARTVLRDYRNDAEPEIRATVATAILALAAAMETSGQLAWARNAYSALIRDFESAEEPRLAVAVAQARRRLDGIAGTD